VLIGGLDPFYLPLLRGIEDVAAEHGLLVLIGDTRDSAAVAETMIRRLVARGVAGIIAASVGGIGRVEGGSRRGTGRVPPIVYVDQPERTGHVFLFDGRAAGAAATRHLFEHGHRRVGIITAPLAWPNVRQVFDGYADVLDKSGPVSIRRWCPRSASSRSRPAAQGWRGCSTWPVPDGSVRGRRDPRARGPP